MSKLMITVALFTSATLYDPQRMAEFCKPGVMLIGNTLDSVVHIDRHSLSRLARG